MLAAIIAANKNVTESKDSPIFCLLTVKYVSFENIIPIQEILKGAFLGLNAPR